MIILRKHSQHCINSKKPVRMHSTHVIPYELVIGYGHNHDNKEIQSPHHFAETKKRIVFSVIKIPKIA